MDHRTDIDYPGGMSKMAEDLGNLRYDALATFLDALSVKLTSDGDKDATRGREQLAMALKTASQAIHGAAGWIDVAWKISKPYMEKRSESLSAPDPPV